jgi:hypothetical protein
MAQAIEEQVHLVEEKLSMNSLKSLAIVSCLGLTALLPNAVADTWNKKTILTVNEPIQVPGKVLQPGKYVMKLMDSPSNRHIVQIYNDREDELQTTILAIPNYRLQPTGTTEFQWWETPAGQPKAMRAWFYPGDNFGQEFAYPKTMSVEIAKTNNTAVPTTSSTTQEDLASSRVTTVDQSGKEAELGEQYKQQTAEAPAPAPAPVETAQNTPPPAPEPTVVSERTLPRTASAFPMIAMAGFLALGASIALRALGNRAA